MLKQLTAEQTLKLNRMTYELASGMVLYDNTLFMQNLDEDDDVLFPIIEAYVTDIRENYSASEIMEVIDNYADAFKEFFSHARAMLENEGGEK